MRSRVSVGTVQGPGDVELTVDEIDHQHIRAMIDGYMRYSPREKGKQCWGWTPGF